MFTWNPKTHFYLRLVSLICLVLFLIFDCYWAIFHPMPKFANLGYGDRASVYFAYFTTQTNYLVAFYFLIYLFENKFKNTKPHYIIRLAVTTYITITMLVFWTGIFSQASEPNQYDLWRWIATVILHLVMPVAMITSYVLTAGDENYDGLKHHYLYLWLIMLYMLLYFTFTIIRGTLRQWDGKDPISWFPYGFLDYTKEFGEELLVISLVVIFTIAILLQYFYIWINNLLYNRYHKPENPLPKQKCNKRCYQPARSAIIGGAIAIAITVANMVICALMIFGNLEEFEYLHLSFSNKLTLVGFFTISVIMFVAMIVCYVYILRGRQLARIAAGLLMMSLMFFTWIWLVGPILCLASAIMIFNGKEIFVGDNPPAEKAKQPKKIKQHQKNLS
ncbi:hypothetical protein SSYRP_v1c07300 [Spiroplasma syrphidicola EA-1]|uniref:Transmembrane protein n=1 Tax=Spiroplasma syrphidicola EA-1 TaxID=1276229 RepID=R4UJK7_9MOLU|nr:hypothetical protein [Spiroplasma syrphidicola]AGM26320.1 hypothetical protein SSYRP_v1c07300 [Spiroplasma syrphidicola EA-1]